MPRPALQLAASYALTVSLGVSGQVEMVASAVVERMAMVVMGWMGGFMVLILILIFFYSFSVACAVREQMFRDLAV